MAANFWNSTHYKHWLRKAETLLTEQRLSRQRENSPLNEEDINKADTDFPQLISQLAQVTNLRQRIAATAIVYFKRFYVRNSYCDHDPRLITPVSLYLAAKAEEHTLQAKLVMAQMTNIYASNHKYPYTTEHLYEYEFKMISSLNFDLIVYHPYRPLVQYCTDLRRTELLATAWPILNDSYQTDAILLYPPYLIAIACICMAGTVEDIDMMQWMKSLSVDTREVGDIVLMLASVYSTPKFSNTTVTFESVLNKLDVHFAGKVQPGDTSAKVRKPLPTSVPATSR